MEKTIVETLGTLKADGSLELDEAVAVPPGRVKVRLESIATQEPSKESLVDFVDRARRELAAAGHKFRSGEAIDAELDELRSEWDRSESH